MYLLGIDLGSSSIKTSLVEVANGNVVSSVTEPAQEMPIDAPADSWAEQDTGMWWEHLDLAMRKLLMDVDGSRIEAIGIAYQMHGLVVVDKNGQVLRPAIIWCDSRAVDIGRRAYEGIGRQYCLSHLYNSPGNFTASKLKWLRDNEPHVFEKIDKILLPGDYLAFRLSGTLNTTISGLSEGIFWDFANSTMSRELMDYYGFSAGIIPEPVPTFGIASTLSNEIAERWGLRAGIPISYRAGDQPNNALSLNVMNPGEMAATGGTSGVVYGVSEFCENDPENRVNIFAHVNHQKDFPRLGILLCINGCGILNSWMRKQLGFSDYEQMNKSAGQVAIGSDGLCILPFGNGAERVLGNLDPGSHVCGLRFNTHGSGHLLRATQEGIAFAFNYGIEVMKAMGFEAGIMRAGRANLFLSDIFRTTLATTSGIAIEMYDTDGAKGAALGAGIGAGIYSGVNEAMSNLKLLETTQPDSKRRSEYQSAYENWRGHLQRLLPED